MSLFVCFVDFCKAYDSVWQEALFFKLLKNEIKGKIFRVIENMYKGCIAGVKSNGSVSAMFECRKQSGTKPNLVAKILATNFGCLFL